jgi:hypothetical protein
LKFFEVEQAIAAPPERVWAVLVDRDALTSGATGVLKIEGAIGPGARLKIWSRVAPDQAFALKVAAFDPPRRMVWDGGMPFGLFRGVRQFNLTPIDGGTKFHMREEFSGPMLALIGPSLPDLNPSFRQFAAALKAMAEK